jgi:hypothetical protein
MAQQEGSEGAEIILGPWQSLPPPVSRGGGPGGPSGGTGPPSGIDLGERIARVEAAIEGLRHSQNLTIGATAILAAFVVGFGIYGLQKIDQIQDSFA